MTEKSKIKACIEKYFLKINRFKGLENQGNCVSAIFHDFF